MTTQEQLEQLERAMQADAAGEDNTRLAQKLAVYAGRLSAIREAMGKGEPDGHLHDDGCGDDGGELLVRTKQHSDVCASGFVPKVLRQLEWSARYSYCTGWPCCPICHGIKPGHGADERGVLPDNQGHRPSCELRAALKELA